MADEVVIIKIVNATDHEIEASWLKDTGGQAMADLKSGETRFATIKKGSAGHFRIALLEVKD